MSQMTISDVSVTQGLIVKVSNCDITGNIILLLTNNPPLSDSDYSMFDSILNNESPKRYQFSTTAQKALPAHPLRPRKQPILVLSR
jgi:hypothetical protein